MKKILLVFAHPDDESITVGGTVAKYVKAGWTVDLLCATNGEEGQSGQTTLTGQALGEIRAQELGKAATVLGISSTTIIGLNDGRLSELTPGTLEDPIYRAIELVLPDIIITFDQTGVSNHPDHIKISYATTYAFQRYVDWLLELQKKFLIRAKYDELWFKRLEMLIRKRMEPTLYFSCIPESIVRHAVQEKILPGELFGSPLRGIPDERISTVIDIRKYRDTKVQALKAHVSQMTDIDRIVALEGIPSFDQEYFVLRMEGKREFFMGKNDTIRNAL